MLLDLDPDTAKDQHACEKRLEEKRRQGAQQSGGIGKPALEARAKLAQIPEIKRILADDQLRMQQAAAARVERARMRKEDRERFEKELEFAEAKGYVLGAEIARWVKEFAATLTEQDIRAAIHVACSSSVWSCDGT